jgi:hypothetical protein
VNDGEAGVEESRNLVVGTIWGVEGKVFNVDKRSISALLLGVVSINNINKIFVIIQIK